MPSFLPPRQPDAIPPRAAPTGEAPFRAHPGLPPPGALHILNPDARVCLDGGVLRVDRPTEPTVHIRLIDLRALVLHGTASITTPTIHALLRAGIPLLWRSHSGHYVGQTVDLSGGSARHRRAQYLAQGTPLGLAIAGRLVSAKIANMRALLRRRRQLGPALDTATRRMVALETDAMASPSLDRLRGLEGAATAAYFGCWPDLARSGSHGWNFPGRKRRPPQGAANAVLSYCSAVVTGECASALLAAGLDVTEGFLHVSRAGRPALALDLVEPFRPAVADSTTLALLNTGAIQAGDVAETAEGSALTDAGRRKALQGLERRLLSPAIGGETTGRDWRWAIAAAARSLAQALTEGNPAALCIPVQR